MSHANAIRNAREKLGKDGDGGTVRPFLVDAAKMRAVSCGVVCVCVGGKQPVKRLKCDAKLIYGEPTPKQRRVFWSRWKLILIARETGHAVLNLRLSHYPPLIRELRPLSNLTPVLGWQCNYLEILRTELPLGSDSPSHCRPLLERPNFLLFVAAGCVNYRSLSQRQWHSSLCFLCS